MAEPSSWQAGGGTLVFASGSITWEQYEELIRQQIIDAGERAVRALTDKLIGTGEEVKATVLESARRDGESRMRQLIEDVESAYPPSIATEDEDKEDQKVVFWQIASIGAATDRDGNVLRDEFNRPRIEIKLTNREIGETKLITPTGFNSEGRVLGFIDSASPAAISDTDPIPKYKITQSDTNPAHIQRVDETGASEVSYDFGETWQTGALPIGTAVTEIQTDIITDASTGERYIVNAATGVRVSESLGVDPEWQYRQSVLEVDRDRLGEDQRQFNLEFDEDRRQFGMEFGEDQRQFDTTENRLERTLAASNYFNSLEELGRNYRTLIQTAPQMANAATQQGELIRNILSQGGDVLARTFFTRGGQTPLPEITQADLLNNLTKEMTQIQQYESDAIKAENQRRTRSDARRADEEFRQAEEQRRADARAQYGRFVNEMRPTVNESSSFDAEGYKSHQERIAEAQANLDNATNFDYSSIVVGTNPDGSDRLVDPNLVAGIRAQSIKAAQDALDAIPAATEADYTTFSRTETMPDKPAFADWLKTSEFATPLDRSKFVPSFAPSQMLNVPEVPVPRMTSQAELIASDIATRPPAVDAMFAGTMPRALQFGDLPLPTLQQLNTLTPTERQMFNTSLLTQFNTPLEDVALQSQRQFGAPSMDRNRDLARFRGFAR